MIKNEWYAMGEITQENINGNSILLKFEDGSVKKYNEEHPLLTITHWMLLSEDVEGVLDLTEWKK